MSATRTRHLVWIAAGAALVLVAASVWWAEDPTAPGEARRSTATPVEVATVRERRFVDTLRALGTIRANESVEIASPVSDTISEIRIESGQRVAAGEVLFVLSGQEESAALAEAEASLRDAERESGRLDRLAGDGAVSRADRDVARAERDRSRAQLDAARARLADREVRAPFGGVVGLRSVSPGAFVAAGTRLVTLDDLDTVQLEFPVPERYLSTLEVGQTLIARAAAWPDETFRGDVESIDTRVDADTRTVAIRARLSNPDGRLRPGMLLTVRLERAARAAPAVPEIAVLRRRDTAYLFVVAEGRGGETTAAGSAGPSSVATRRALVLGGRDGAWLEVVDGLEVGERIVVEGVHRVRDGAALRVVGETLRDDEGGPPDP